jgi:hypothetical protein
MTLKDQILSILSNHPESSKVLVPSSILVEASLESELWLPEGITIETQEMWLISAVSAAGDIVGNYTVIAWQ